MNHWLDSLGYPVAGSGHTSGGNGRARLAFTFLLIAALACNLPSSDSSIVNPTAGTQAAADEAPQPEIEVAAIRLESDEITYSARLINRGNTQLGDLTLEFDIPSGGTVQEVMTTPLSSEMQQSNERVIWKIPGLPANTLVGPFAYRVTFHGEPNPVEARANWPLSGTDEIRAVVTRIEEASESDVTAGMAAGPLTEIPGSGIRYFVPFGDRGRVSLQRSEQDPVAGVPDELAWVGAYQVAKEKPGSAIFVVPLRQPARPFLLVRVFVDGSQGIYEQPMLGTVTSDGLHAAFAADGASSYYLGVDGSRLNSATADLTRATGESIISGALEALVTGKGAIDDANAISDLVESLGTDSVVIDTGDGWFVLPDVIEDNDPGSGGISCSSDSAGNTTCSYTDGAGGPCDGHGGGVGDYPGGGGVNYHYCADGHVYFCYDSGDCDSVSSAGETQAAATHAAETHAAETASASIFPGPCPVMTCMIDSLTGGLSTYDDMYFTESLMGLLDLINNNWTVAERVNFAAPPSTLQHVQEPGASTDARGIRSVISVVGNNILVGIPGGQRWQLLVGMPAPSDVNSSPEGTPPPTVTSTATLQIVPVTIPPQPPTETFTPKPQDNEGPAIKGVSAAPDPIYASAPKGCKPTLSGISATISDPSGVASAVVIYIGPSAGSAPMSNTGGNNWRAQLGPFNAPAAVNYQIRAFDTLGNRSDTAFSALTVNACIP